MKLKLSFLTSLLFVFLLIPQSVSAQNTRSKPTPGVVVNARVKTELKNSGEENRVKLSLVRKEKIMSYSNKLTVRLDAMVERLKLLITRIEARILKIEESDEEIALTETKSTMTEAKQLLVGIDGELILLKENLANIPEAEDPKQMFENVRTSLMSIKEDLKEVHQLLVKVVGDIKGLRI